MPGRDNTFAINLRTIHKVTTAQKYNYIRQNMAKQ